MIIQTGMRTDIPAFYAKWLVNRIRAGYVLVRNPYNPSSITQYSLDPAVVDLLCFCTKNPAPILPYMEWLKRYAMYWFVTITPYGEDIEPNVPPKECVMESFCQLSRMVGADRVVWRYDPILVNEVYTVERHLADFEEMAATLAGYTNVCVISYIDLYAKVRRNFPEVRAVNPADRLRMGKAFIRIDKRYGITIRPCSEGTELAQYGADCRGCMTREIYEQAAGMPLNFPRYQNARETCACYLGGDIGQYDTCGHLCRYCYANTDASLVRRNMRRHNPESPLLVGHVHPDDKVHVATQTSWLNRQQSLF